MQVNIQNDTNDSILSVFVRSRIYVVHNIVDHVLFYHRRKTFSVEKIKTFVVS